MMISVCFKQNQAFISPKLPIYKTSLSITSTSAFGTPPHPRKDLFMDIPEFTDLPVRY